jgi:arabinogalactan oligomer/maltooligosaccharide transport system substrate-binding protein
MKIRKSGLAAAAGVLTASMLGMAVPAQAATTITIWMDQGSKDAIGTALTAWDNANTAVSVTVVVKPFGDLRKAAITAIPKGTGPDIIAGAHDWTGALVGAGVVAPVSLGGTAAKFSAAAKSGFSVGGKLYGVPAWTENTALIYNKTKISAASVPNTTAKFAAAIAAGKLGMHIDFKNGGTDPYHMSAFASSFGLDEYVRKNGDWTKTLGFTDAASGGGLTKYAAWLGTKAKKIAFADWNTNAYNFQKVGNPVSLMISGPWGSGTVINDTHTVNGDTPEKLTKSQVGIALIPSIGGKPVHQFSGVRGYWMSKKVVGTSKATAAGAVLLALAGKTIQLSSFTTEGKAPANSDALAAVSDAHVKGFGNAGKGAYPMPSFPFQDATFQAIGKSEAAIIKGGDALLGKSALGYFVSSIKAQQSFING